MLQSTYPGRKRLLFPPIHQSQFDSTDFVEEPTPLFEIVDGTLRPSFETVAGSPSGLESSLNQQHLGVDQPILPIAPSVTECRETWP
ncbi:MAG: hypothetical protein HOI66_08160 [Verrucomicrobia bacterium]|nr:hypothetical protein [Verrucomicrobiota bacterium]MDA7511504.1 hypothetical protein [Verrucomicrobiota bacterium]